MLHLSSKRHFLSFVFDLDGTSVDSFPVIQASPFYAILLQGSTLRSQNLRSKACLPLTKLLPKIWLDLDPSGIANIPRRPRIHYDCGACLPGRPYPDLKMVLKGPGRSIKKLMLLTHKPLRPARKILELLKFKGLFTDILCPDSVSPRLKSKRKVAKPFVKKHRFRPVKTLLVGDRVDDVDSAKAARLRLALPLTGIVPSWIEWLEQARFY